MGGAKTSARTKAAIKTKAAKNAKRAKATTTIKNKEQPQPGQEWWKTMAPLFVKRFADDDPKLTAGAKRNRNLHPHVAVAELDPTGRSNCKQCGEIIQPKGKLRMNMMLECEKGYRFACTLHEACFWQHRESKKISYDNIFIKPGVESKEINMIKAKFDARDKEETNIAA